MGWMRGSIDVRAAISPSVRTLLTQLKSLEEVLAPSAAERALAWVALDNGATSPRC